MAVFYYFAFGVISLLLLDLLGYLELRVRVDIDQLLQEGLNPQLCLLRHGHGLHVGREHLNLLGDHFAEFGVYLVFHLLLLGVVSFWLVVETGFFGFQQVPVLVYGL